MGVDDYAKTKELCPKVELLARMLPAEGLCNLFEVTKKPLVARHVAPLKTLFDLIVKTSPVNGVEDSPRHVNWQPGTHLPELPRVPSTAWKAQKDQDAQHASGRRLGGTNPSGHQASADILLGEQSCDARRRHAKRACA